MISNKYAFTLVELIVVVMILWILSTIGLANYMSQMSTSRNAARQSDMANLMIALKSHKTKNGSYPMPGDFFTIQNGGLDIIKQWYLNNNVASQEIVKKPQDPLYKNQYYVYSTLANRQSFQIAMSLEDESVNELWLKAYVDGDYQSTNIDWIPSIIFAYKNNAELSTLSNKFIINNSSFNIPYDGEGIPQAKAVSLSQIVTWNESEIPKYYGYSSCGEIADNGMSMGSGTYRLDIGLTPCAMNN